MLRQYGQLNSELFRKAADILTHAEHWPRFADIDGVIKTLQEKAAGEKAMKTLPTPSNVSTANKARIKLIVEHTAKHGNFKGLLQESAANVVDFAKRHFPDCDMDFIRRNYNDLNAARHCEEMCASHTACNDCPFVGHKMFLRINKYGGNTYMCADMKLCSRYHGGSGNESNLSRA